MAHTYRYYTADLLTGTVISEMPFYGVFCSKKINEAGSFTGSFKLNSGMHDDQSLLDGSIPGRTCIYVERDGSLVWGGILWARTYASESKAIQVAGQTFESYFDHVCIDANFIQQDVEQTTILTNLVNLLQGQSGNNIGLLLGSMPTTGVVRTVLIPGYEYHFAQDVISQLIGVDNGLEMTIDIAATGTIDHPSRTIRVGYPKLGSAVTTSGLYYDYPGNITNFWWSESGSRGAVKAVALGHGDGFNKVRAQAVDGNKLGAGWPAWWIVNAHANIADIDEIAAAARKDLEKYAIPYSRPTFEFTADVGATFNSWNNLGDEVMIRIEDPRFPGGKIVQSRMIGWELTPSQSESPEVIKIVIEGDDGG